MLEIKTNKDARKLVLKTFQKINDIVVPTMGAKGLLVALDEDFGKSTITDDGVTVARQAIHLDGLEKMIALDMIEAANTTEKEALDGTTLTILLTNEIYKRGYRMIQHGAHPQRVADLFEEEIDHIRSLLKMEVKPLRVANVKDIAIISTKIPMIGNIVEEAWMSSGTTLNVIIEHDRESDKISVESTKGFSIDSGFMSEAMMSLCPDGDKWIQDNVHIVLLKEGIMTQAGLGAFFKSIPTDIVKEPFVFVLNPAFNPNTLRLLIDTLISNKMTYQFIFINETKMDDVYMDLAAVSGGKVQDASSGIGDYLFEHCGFADHCEIEIDKSIFVCKSKHKEVNARIKSYRNKLDKKFKVSGVDLALYTKRLGALENGVVKIKVGVPTVTEFKTLHLKLDDAIGAVKKAKEQGVVLGGGKALYNIALKTRYLHLNKILEAPIKQILSNSGIKIFPYKKYLRDENNGVDVRYNRLVDLKRAGILDSYASIDQALKNSCSIACSYLKTNCLIKKGITQNK